MASCKSYSEALSEGMKGNKNGTKIKDADLRQKAYRAYCDWLASGKSPRSFVFREGNLTCLGETIEEYMKKDPAEFPAIHRQAAYAEGYAHWEQVCAESAKGDNEKANTASLQMIMRNKYGWDKREDTKDNLDLTLLDKFLEKLDVKLK